MVGVGGPEILGDADGGLVGVMEEREGGGGQVRYGYVLLGGRIIYQP